MNVELTEPDKIEVDLIEFVGIDIPKDKIAKQQLLLKIHKKLLDALHESLNKDHIKGWDHLEVYKSPRVENLICVKLEPKVVRDLIIFKLKENG